MIVNVLVPVPLTGPRIGVVRDSATSMFGKDAPHPVTAEAARAIASRPAAVSFRPWPGTLLLIACLRTWPHRSAGLVCSVFLIGAESK